MMTRPQISVLDELIVDNFAGGGGASTGIELAAGRVVDIAINHDSDAILMHRTNHPYTRHYQASVWDIDPVEVCAGQPVGLAWFSPDCKHFSKAKGGKPVNKEIRGLAWITLRWAGTVRPRVIILENVEEFQTWGPVRRGKPVKSKKGQTFDKFIAQLRSLGYTVEWRELVAADYGAPTTRKRFFLVARCDGKPVVWPEPTHAPRDSEAVKSGSLKPWRSAAEVIDWSLPCPSIFDSKQEIKEKYGITAVRRPLRPNTIRRVARGVDKFVIRNATPFIVPMGYGEAPRQAPRVHNMDNPLPTSVGTGKHGLVSPTMIQYHTEQSEWVRGQSVTEPIMTIDAANRYGLAASHLTKYYSGDHAQNIADPMHTATTKDREGVVAAAFMQVNHAGGYHGKGQPPTAPINTITSSGGISAQVAHMVKMKGTNLGGLVTEPVQTITAGGGHHGVVTTTIVKAALGVELRNWPKIRELLNTYCDYTLDDDEVILFDIGGAWHFLADIGLRMLTPRELYRANGFPDDYIIDRDYEGNEYGTTKQVARCGNAVPPPFATALVRANLPEWCDQKITTMAEFGAAVAV